MASDPLTALFTMIERVGFPIGVAAFLLWRLNGKLQKFGELMVESTNTLRDIARTLREHDDRTREAIHTIDRMATVDRMLGGK